jgi:hypothetical protein
MTMKRLLLVALLTLMPLAAYGDYVDHDTILADDGTLFTVESQYAKDLPGLKTVSERVLTLTIQKDGKSSVTTIPATLTGGWHVYPALAYDAQSSTLFVFWEGARNTFFSTQLYVCSYANGQWGQPKSLDSAEGSVRQNLHIAITHMATQIATDGTSTQVPEINVHAVWWEDNGAAEWARYAMITVEKGAVTSIAVQDLSTFDNSPAPNTQPAPDAARELLRHPAVAEARTHDSVDVLYGDVNAVTLHRTNIRPTIQGGRLRVPTGRGGALVPAPIANVATNTIVNTIMNGDSIALYYDATPDTINYLTWHSNAWSPARILPLSEKLTHDAAVTALQRLITTQ